jgi:membrane associated rhomboid family serine protease
LSDPLELLRSAPSRSRAEEWALVLASQGVPSELRADAGRWLLRVAAEQRDPAAALLERWELENTERPELPRPGALRSSWAGVALGAALLLFAAFTGPAARGTRWFRRGAADASALLDGELWRALTALTLHVDAAHVISNALAAAIFLGWLGQRVGSGVGVALVLASGVLGNLANAFWQGDAHRSVGASTALFGALGILSGLEAGRRWFAGIRVARAWLPLAAGLALLAMLGTGRGSDIGAHVFGLLAGAGLGVAVSRLADAPARVGSQAAAWAAASAALVAAWWKALSG